MKSFLRLLLFFTLCLSGYGKEIILYRYYWDKNGDNVLNAGDESSGTVNGVSYSTFDDSLWAEVTPVYLGSVKPVDGQWFIYYRRAGGTSEPTWAGGNWSPTNPSGSMFLKRQELLGSVSFTTSWWEFKSVVTYMPTNVTVVPAIPPPTWFHPHTFKTQYKACPSLPACLAACRKVPMPVTVVFEQGGLIQSMYEVQLFARQNPTRGTEYQISIQGVGAKSWTNPPGNPPIVNAWTNGESLPAEFGPRDYWVKKNGAVIASGKVSPGVPVKVYDDYSQVADGSGESDPPPNTLGDPPPGAFDNPTSVNNQGQPTSATGGGSIAGAAPGSPGGASMSGGTGTGAGTGTGTGSGTEGLTKADVEDAVHDGVSRAAGDTTATGSVGNVDLPDMAGLDEEPEDWKGAAESANAKKEQASGSLMQRFNDYGNAMQSVPLTLGTVAVLNAGTYFGTSIQVDLATCLGGIIPKLRNFALYLVTIIWAIKVIQAPKGYL